MNRLEPFVYVALLQKIHERACDHRLILRAHRQVRVVPLPQHAQPFEIGALQIDVLLRILAARAADLHRRHLRFLRAQFAIHLDFDGQPVAIPTRHVRRVEARHGLRLHDEVLQDFVERRAQVNAPVGIRRPVVQNVARPAGCDAANLVIQPLLLPPRQRLRLGLRQVGLHREGRLRQIDGLLEVYALRIIHCRE